MDVETLLRRYGPFLRRGELVRSGVSDRQLAEAVRAGRILRVRHGWYALPDVAALAARAVRVGGRVTGIAALRCRGLILPQPGVIDLVVPATASGLRSPTRSRSRLGAFEGVRIHWHDPPRGARSSGDWLASEEDALGVVLRTAGRELAVATCDGLLRYRGWDRARLARCFERAPRRTRGWLDLVDARADAWGETLVRLRLGDVGIPFEPQAWCGPVGPFDGRVSPRVFIEVDGPQHAEEAFGGAPGRFERDRAKDLMAAVHGGRVLRFTYRQLEREWPTCLRAIERARADDLAGARIRSAS